MAFEEDREKEVGASTHGGVHKTFLDVAYCSLQVREAYFDYRSPDLY
jgi:hypothetical protein